MSSQTSNKMPVMPKITSGLKFGGGSTILLTLTAAVFAQNWEMVLTVFIVSVSPVLVQFLRAYAKTDPRLSEAMRLLDEVEAGQQK